MTNIHRTFCILLLLVSLIFSGCASSAPSADEIYLGMTYDEFFQVVPKDTCFAAWGYAVFYDATGDVCAVYFGRNANDMTLKEIQVFEKENIDKSVESFEKIQCGTSLYEVFALVGVPDGTATSGMATIRYDWDGGFYRIYLSDVNEDTITVESISYVTYE